LAPDISALREQIHARLPRVAAELQGLIRNSIRIETIPVNDEALLLPGTSKFGGLPDLPEDLAWPEWNGQPLAFIAQFRLEEIAPFDLDRLLPATGMLYYFYEAQQDTWGFDPKDEGSARCLYYDGDTARIRRTPFPETLHEWGRDYPPCRLQLSAEASLPGGQSMYIDRLALSEDEVAAYDGLIEWMKGPDEDFGGHRLLGYANAVQNDYMEEECALVTGGIYLGGPEAYQTEEAQELKKTAPEWQLLLQVDSDNDAGMMWGDSGLIYYWIKTEDLARRDFESVWLILQCF
jgi:uncharacterized protein YwqG